MHKTFSMARSARNWLSQNDPDVKKLMFVLPGPTAERRGGRIKGCLEIASAWVYYRFQRVHCRHGRANGWKDAAEQDGWYMLWRDIFTQDFGRFLLFRIEHPMEQKLRSSMLCVQSKNKNKNN